MGSEVLSEKSKRKFDHMTTRADFFAPGLKELSLMDY